MPAAISSQVSLDRSHALDAFAVLVLAAAGLVLAFQIFPTDMLLDRWSWWERVSGDVASSLAGWIRVAQEPWGWPPLHVENLDPPAGGNVIFMDVLPLLALPAKLWFQLSGELHPYFGRWILLSFALQGPAAYAILREYAVDRVPAALGALLILLTPALMARAGVAHVNLLAHFVILLAILSYARATRAAGKVELACWAVIFPVALLTHPYLFAMSLPAMLAGFIDAAQRGRISWPGALLLIGASLAVTLVIAFLLGIIGNGSVPRGSLGYYAMNVLSPVMPQFSQLPGFENYELDATGGQYEGYNYLGLSGLALIATAFVVGRRDLRLLRSCNPALVAALILLTAFAISPVIYVGHWLVVKIPYRWVPLISDMASQFSSSGRFFWPVGYMLLLASIILIWRQLGRAVVIAIVGVAIAVQFWETTPLRARVPDAYQFADHIDRPLWSSLLSRHSELAIYPDYQCTPTELRVALLQVQLLAARADIPSNATYFNRKRINCKKPPTPDHMINPTTPDPLVLVYPDNITGKLNMPVLDSSFVCVRGEQSIVCSKHASDPDLLKLGTPLAH